MGAKHWCKDSYICIYMLNCNFIPEQFIHENNSFWPTRTRMGIVPTFFDLSFSALKRQNIFEAISKTTFYMLYDNYLFFIIAATIAPPLIGVQMRSNVQLSKLLSWSLEIRMTSHKRSHFTGHSGICWTSYPGWQQGNQLSSDFFGRVFPQEWPVIWKVCQYQDVIMDDINIYF